MMKYINMKIFHIKQSFKGAYFVHYVTFGPLSNLQNILKSKATMITKEKEKMVVTLNWLKGIATRGVSIVTSQRSDEHNCHGDECDTFYMMIKLWRPRPKGLCKSGHNRINSRLLMWPLLHQQLLKVGNFNLIWWPKITLGGRRLVFRGAKMLKFSLK